MTKINWDESAELDKLAELSIKTGVALQPGQDLIITAPIEAAPPCVNWRSMHTKRVQAL